MKRFIAGLVLTVAGVVGPAAEAKNPGTVTWEFYGTTADGQDVYEYTLTNAGKRPLEVKIITYGGIITSIMMPDKWGHKENVVLGFNNLQDYETKSPYFDNRPLCQPHFKREVHPRRRYLLSGR